MKNAAGHFQGARTPSFEDLFSGKNSFSGVPERFSAKIDSKKLSECYHFPERTLEIFCSEVLMAGDDRRESRRRKIGLR
ncbi:MAG: hypothetical protein PHP59_06230 [Methanofollis sp.]|uniref:hypothetical protein n=1 Tax=Methanofollis sp. TaxID=2052835 RepID=UPI002628BC0B|nr:hypothetical protein [Methanofollis sp.]MDD4254960.1 hypothetical protein [Methanofollis sp.]